MSSAAIRGGRVAIEIGADTRKFFAALNAVQARLRRLGSTLSGAGAGLAGIGASVLGPLAAASTVAAGFQDTMSAVAAVSGATGDEFDTLKKRAMDLGASTSFTAQQVAEAMQVLAQGGFSVEETLGSIDGVLNLARAGMIDLATATDYTVSVLRAFNMPTTEAAKVADVLAMAANASNASISDLGESLSVVSGIAAGVGVSMSEVVAMLGTLADRGQKGSIAGTGLRRIFVALASEADKLKGLGVEVKDRATGKLRPILDIMDDLRESLKDLDDTDKLAKLTEIFDVFGANAVFNLLAAGDATRTLLGELDNSAGSAARVAAMMDDNLGGSFRMLMSAIEGVAIEIGEALTPSLRYVMDRLQAVAAGLGAWLQKNQEAVVSVAKLAAAFVGGGGALIGMGLSLQLVAVALGGFTAALQVVLSPVSLLSKSLFLVSGSFSSATKWIGAIGATLLRSAGQFVSFTAATAAMAAQFAGRMALMTATATATAIRVGAAWAGAAVAGTLAYIAHIKALVTYYTGAMAGIVAITITRLGQAAGAWIAMAGAGIASFIQNVTLGLAMYAGQLAAMVSTTVASMSALAAAWLAPVAPIAGLVAVIGGIGLAVRAAVSGAGGLTQSLTGFVEPARASMQAFAADAAAMFSDIYTIGEQTFRGVYDAIAGGDLQLAVQIAWAGMQAAWMRGQATIMAYVDSWVESIQNVVGDIQTVLAQGMVRAVGVMERTWIAFAGGFYDAWSYAVNGVLNVWDTAVGAIQKAIAYVRSFLDDSVDYDAIAARIDEANAANKRQRENAVKRNQTARASQVQASRDGENAQVAELEQQNREARAGRAARSAGRAVVREVGVQQAQQEVDDLSAKGKASRESRDLIRQAQQAETPDELRKIWETAQQMQADGLISQERLAEIEQAIDDQTSELDQKRVQEEKAGRREAEIKKATDPGPANDKLDSAGTFSARAAAQMGYSQTLAERTAVACENTARNTQNPRRPRVSP